MFLGLIVLSAIVALVVWAIRTQSADSVLCADERRRWRDRREREVPDFPARAERRRTERRASGRGVGDTAPA